MEAQIAIKLYYDRAKDGSLSEFRTKFLRFRSHIERLQASGALPREEIRWVVQHKLGPDGPKEPAASIILPPPAPDVEGIIPGTAPRLLTQPLIFHRAGKPLLPTGTVGLPQHGYGGVR